MNMSFLFGKFRKRKPRCLNYSTFTTTHAYSAPRRRLIYFVLVFILALNFRGLYVVKTFYPIFQCDPLFLFMWTAPWLILKTSMPVSI